MKDIDKMQNCQRMSRLRTIKELQIISSVVFIAIELVNFVQPFYEKFWTLIFFIRSKQVYGILVCKKVFVNL